MKLSAALSSAGVVNFTKLYNENYSLVYSIVFSKVNNHHDAEDICQEIFLRFYRNLYRIENPRKWLLGCMRIVILDFYKGRKSEEDVDELFNDISMGYVNGFREARVVISQVIEEITNECDNEDSVDMTIFNLIAVYKYSIVETAEHLKLNYKQTRYRYNRICERITSRLRERGIKEIGDLL